MHIPDDEFDDALSDLENLQARGVDVGAALRRLLNHAPRRPTLPRSSTSAAPQQPRVVPHVQAHIVHNVRASTTLNPSATPLDAATATPPPLAVTPTPLLAATFSASTPAPFAAGTLQERVNSGRARSLPPSLSQQRMLPFQPTLFIPSTPARSSSDMLTPFNTSVLTPFNLSTPSKASTPTVVGGSPTNQNGFPAKVVPPLRIQIDTDVDMGPPSPLSPVLSSPHPTSPSPASTTLGKRLAADRLYTNEEGESERDDDDDSDVTVRRPRKRTARRGGGGGGGGGGDGGAGPAHLWTRECKRNGDRVRANGDASIGAMPCQDGTCPGCDAQQQQSSTDTASGSSGGIAAGTGEGSGSMDASDGGALYTSGPQTRAAAARAAKKGGAAPVVSLKGAALKEVGWCIDPNGGPPMTKTAGNVLSAMLAVWNSKGRDELEILLQGPDTPDSFSAPYDPTNTEAVFERILRLTKRSRIVDLELIFALIQLALNVDSEIATGTLNHEYTSKSSIAKRFKQKRQTFNDHLAHGYRFAFLAAAGTLGLIPIIAALDLRTTVTRQMEVVDVQCLGVAMREVQHGKWLPLMRQLIRPVNDIRHRPGFIQTFRLSYKTPVGPRQTAKIIEFGVQDTAISDKIFDALQTNTLKLDNRGPEWKGTEYNFTGYPDRSSQWDLDTPPPSWNPMPDATEIKMPTPVTVTVPVHMGPNASPLPFKTQDRKGWTADQRELAHRAVKATSVSDLQTKITAKHQGVKWGTCENYIEINSGILKDEALFIRDLDSELIGLLFTVGDEFKDSLRRGIDHINNILNGEFKTADSRAEAFKYLSLHYSWYARYAEKGDTAPKDVHPNKCRKTDVKRVNIQQRLPHMSKEILDKPREYALLADAFTDFFQVVNASIAHLIPQETKQLCIFVDKLPLGASSPCYPFGGFVINIDACTDGHRDAKDKRLCLVAPLGKFTGGQLCLYEGGLSFDLQLGDVLVFPSWRITHFNTHFKGMRATIVLHTDKEADSWTRNCHGWYTYVVTHGSAEEGA